jgi:hypothetical protein
MDGTAQDFEIFAENRYLAYKWDRETIIATAPEASGVYGLYNAIWIYVGEADNIRARLLEHLAGDNPWINHYGPSGFAFELVPAQVRHDRYRELVRQAEPICERKSFIVKGREVPANAPRQPVRNSERI